MADILNDMTLRSYFFGDNPSQGLLLSDLVYIYKIGTNKHRIVPLRLFKKYPVICETIDNDNASVVFDTTLFDGCVISDSLVCKNNRISTCSDGYVLRKPHHTYVDKYIPYGATRYSVDIMPLSKAMIHFPMATYISHDRDLPLINVPDISNVIYHFNNKHDKKVSFTMPNETFINTYIAKQYKPNYTFLHTSLI